MPALFNLLDVEKAYTLKRDAALNRREAPTLKALDGVRLEVHEGESLALVGESGSGKSTLLRVMLGLERPTNGRVLYRQSDMASMPDAERRRFRRDIAFIYQDARGSLNPRMRVAELISEPVLLHRLRDADRVSARVDELLERVGLPHRLRDVFPNELSGGQVRRVAVARALAAKPRVIFADEAVAGLDVSVQAQLLNLLRALCGELGATLVFVTHDLGVASFLCRRIAVMYLGKIVEQGPTAAILGGPQHPYTEGLLRAFPRFGVPLAAALRGEIPSPIDLPRGCRFAGRCESARTVCFDTDPALREQTTERHVACHFPRGTGNAARAA